MPQHRSKDGKERPRNREVESENLRPPAREHQPPRPSTEPPGAELGEKELPDDLLNDPASGKPLR